MSNERAEARLLRRDLRQGAGSQRVALSLWACPEAVPARAPILLFCLPGGGMTRGYYDLRVPGNDGHSFARAMAARGFVVAAMDLPGTGESAGRDDRYAHTPESLADSAARTCARIVDGLRDASLLPELGGLDGVRVVGLGHSMGAMLTILAQARAGCFEAVALLGFSTRGLPEYLPKSVRALLADREALHARRIELARAMFSAMDESEQRRGERNEDLFGRGNAEPDGVRALRACAAPILPVPAFVSMLPDNVADEARALAVPVFLGIGEHDMVGPPHEAPAAFAASHDVTLHVLPGAGHSHFLFPARRGLFERLDGWLRGMPGSAASAGDSIDHSEEPS